MESLDRCAGLEQSLAEPRASWSLRSLLGSGSSINTNDGLGIPMGIERINPDTAYAPANDSYSQVVKATGDTHVHVSGMVGLTQAGDLVSEDMREQTTRGSRCCGFRYRPNPHPHDRRRRVCAQLSRTDCQLVRRAQTRVHTPRSGRPRNRRTQSRNRSDSHR